MAPEYLFSKASLLLVNICFCVTDPEPPFFRRLRSRCHFFVRSEPRAGAALLSRLRLHLFGKQKKSFLHVLRMNSVQLINIY